MADRAYPKPAGNGGIATPAAAYRKGAANNPAFPATRAPPYNTTRPTYRPLSPPRRHRRGCCCCCCLWTTLFVVFILLLAAIAGAAFYVLFRPTRPSFSVANLRLSRFNLTDTAVGSALNFTILAHNDNSRITFSYGPISARVYSDDVEIGDVNFNFPAFTQGTRNVTSLKAVVSRPISPIPDGTNVSPLSSSVKSRNLPIVIVLETAASAKLGRFETKQLWIKVTCGGIRVSIPRAKTASVATLPNTMCKVNPRIEIIGWSFSF